MRRRTALTGALGSVTALVGCLGETVGTEADDEPTRVPDGRQRRVDLVDAGSVPDDVPLTVDVDLRERWITGTQTARLRLTATNDGSPRAVSIGTGGCALFDRSARASAPTGLWLADGAREDDRDGNGWVADDLPTGPDGFGGYGCSPTALDAGDRVVNDYAVWDDGRVDGYLAPGTYRWDESVGVWTGPEADGPADRSFDWHLALELSRPG